MFIPQETGKSPARGTDIQQLIVVSIVASQQNFEFPSKFARRQHNYSWDVPILPTIIALRKVFRGAKES
jgi:hypothetical protein